MITKTDHLHSVRFPNINKANPLTLAICTAMACAPVARGAVTFVNASVNNTVGAASGLVDWNDGSDATGTDGTVTTNDSLWRYRTGFGNTGIWEATGSSVEAEDCAELKITANVTNNTYDVYVFYYPVTTTGDFPIRAGFTSAPNANPVFNQPSGLEATTLTHDVAPPSGSESRPLLYGFVGQVEVTDGSLEVYIDDFPASSTGSSNDRTWFAGIGYAVAGPPPPPPVPDQIKGTLITIDPDAGWIWYTDERAIIDFPRLIAGGVRGKDWLCLLRLRIRDVPKITSADVVGSGTTASWKLSSRAEPMPSFVIVNPFSILEGSINAFASNKPHSVPVLPSMLS